MSQKAGSPTKDGSLGNTHDVSWNKKPIGGKIVIARSVPTTKQDNGGEGVEIRACGPMSVGHSCNDDVDSGYLQRHPSGERCAKRWS